MEKYTVDRVIGTKVCHKCGYPVSVESYSIPEAKDRLERHIFCHRSLPPNEDSEPDQPNFNECKYDLFTNPKFEVKMKPYKEWATPLMRRMSK